MPRAKKTLSGAPGSPAVTPVGVPYGEGERSLESQRRMPVPDFARSQGSAPTTGGTGSGGSAGGQAPAADRFAQALQAAQAMQPPESILDAPTTRPNESLTTGLVGSENPVMPGAVTNDALYELRAIAQMTGYPEFLKLVAEAERGL